MNNLSTHFVRVEKITIDGRPFAANGLITIIPAVDKKVVDLRVEVEDFDFSEDGTLNLISEVENEGNRY